MASRRSLLTRTNNMIALLVHLSIVLAIASGEETEHHGHPQYSFEYGVNDPHTRDVKKQWETRDGDRVQGSYSLKEADGTVRVVDYHANDKTGFNAVVRRKGVSLHPQVAHKRELPYELHVPHHQKILLQQEEEHHLNVPHHPKALLQKEEEHHLNVPRHPKALLQKEEEHHLNVPHHPKALLQKEEEHHLNVPRYPKALLQQEEEHITKVSHHTETEVIHHPEPTHHKEESYYVRVSHEPKIPHHEEVMHHAKIHLSSKEVHQPEISHVSHQPEESRFSKILFQSEETSQKEPKATYKADSTHHKVSRNPSWNEESQHKEVREKKIYLEENLGTPKQAHLEEQDYSEATHKQDPSGHKTESHHKVILQKPETTLRRETRPHDSDHKKETIHHEALPRRPKTLLKPEVTHLSEESYESEVTFHKSSERTGDAGHHLTRVAIQKEFISGTE